MRCAGDFSRANAGPFLSGKQKRGAVEGRLEKGVNIGELVADLWRLNATEEPMIRSKGILMIANRSGALS